MPSKEEINDALEVGVIYNPGSSQQLTDSVKFKVTDGLGHSDTVNFIFKVAGSGGLDTTTLATSGKDIIFATGDTDTLAGGGGADQFVFSMGTGDDTITDFAIGQDHIDLRAFFQTVDAGTEWFTSTNVKESPINTADTLLMLGNDSITLKNVAFTSLTANDFILHPGNN